MRISDWSSDVCSSDLNALRKIAEIVGQIAVDPGDDRLVAEIAVAAERHLAHEEVTDRIEPVAVDEIVGRDDVAQRFRHLLAPIEKMAVGEYALRRSEEHTSELQSLMRLPFAVFCLKQKSTRLNSMPQILYPT